MCRKRDEKGGRGGVAMAYQGDIWPLVAVVVGWEWKYIVLTPVYRENLTPRPRKSTERNCPSSPIPQTHPSFCPSYTYTPLASRWSWGEKATGDRARADKGWLKADVTWVHGHLITNVGTKLQPPAGSTAAHFLVPCPTHRQQRLCPETGTHEAVGLRWDNVMWQ